MGSAAPIKLKGVNAAPRDIPSHRNPGSRHEVNLANPLLLGLDWLRERVQPRSEPLKNDLYQRHGIRCESRQCPRHHQAMGIATDRNSAECISSTLHWWCDSCRGFWSELYFERQKEAQDPSMMGLESNFDLECPDCSSLDVGRECHFSCCDNFICGDCGLYFSVEHQILATSRLSQDQIRVLQFEDTGSRETGEYLDPIVHPVTLETENWSYEGYAFCQNHPGRPVTLVENPNEKDERHRFSWVCVDCKNEEAPTSEYVCRLLRPSFSSFFRRSYSPYQCRICHHALFSREADLLLCDTCGTLMRLQLHYLHKSSWGDFRMKGALQLSREHPLLGRVDIVLREGGDRTEEGILLLQPYWDGLADFDAAARLHLATSKQGEAVDFAFCEISPGEEAGTVQLSYDQGEATWDVLFLNGKIIGVKSEA
ncbi:MAG: hypothetical protein RL095_2384 [Verrucomicrobiota bacterium]